MRQSGASSRSLLSNVSPTLKAASQINAEFSSPLLSLIRLSCPRWVAGKRALGQIGILGFFSESEIVGQEGDGGDGGVKTTLASCSPQVGSCGRSSTLLQG